MLNFVIKFSTNGNCQTVEITDKVSAELQKSGLSSGILTVFVPGSTGAIATMEYEPGLVEDTEKYFKDLVKEKNAYKHDINCKTANASSHLRATLMGPSLTIPFENSKMQLGTWQQITFIEFDNRSRDREIIIKIIGQ